MGRQKPCLLVSVWSISLSDLSSLLVFYCASVAQNCITIDKYARPNWGRWRQGETQDFWNPKKKVYSKSELSGSSRPIVLGG